MCASERFWLAVSFFCIPFRLDFPMSHRRPFICFLSWLFALLLAGSLGRLAAAELRLSNGDRLTGTLIERSEGKLHFRSPLLGDLVIDESAATLVEAEQALVAANESESTDAQLAQAQAEVEIEAGAEAAAPLVAAVEAGESDGETSSSGGVQVPPRVTWSGQIELAIFSQTGRSKNQNSSLRFEASRVSKRNNYRLRSRYLYGKNADQVANDRVNADLRWRRELGPRLFTQSQTSYLRDRVAQIAFNAEQNLSLGYQFLKNARHDLNVGAGATALYRDVTGPSQSGLYLAETFQDYTYKLNHRFTISEGLNLLYSPDGRVVGTSADNAHYKVRFNSALQGKMTERISLNLRFEYEYDNSIVVKEARTDQRITTSVGYSF